MKGHVQNVAAGQIKVIKFSDENPWSISYYVGIHSSIEFSRILSQESTHKIQLFQNLKPNLDHICMVVWVKISSSHTLTLLPNRQANTTIFLVLVHLYETLHGRQTRHWHIDIANKLSKSKFLNATLHVSVLNILSISSVRAK